MGIRPATPGTLVVAAATVLLSLVSASVPVMNSIYFLQANITVTIQSFEVGGAVKLGTFGYCILDECVGPQLGYELDGSTLLNIDGIAGDVLGSLPTTLIKWLTYALVIHPVAAGFAGLATICGLLSHIREFSITGFTTCFAVFGAVLSLLAFVFDMVAFTIAKQRINDSAKNADGDVTADASLGNAVWMTLAAFILLTFSGCFFSFGRCVIRSKANRKSESEKYKPTMDPTFNTQMREDGVKAEKWRKDASTGGSSFRKGKEGGLPAFAEFADQEHVPLTHFNQHDQEYGQQYGRDEEERVSGVGYGAPRPSNMGHTPGMESYDSDMGGAAAAYYRPGDYNQQHQRGMSGHSVPPNASGFQSMYDNNARGYDGSSAVGSRNGTTPAPQATYDYSRSASQSQAAPYDPYAGYGGQGGYQPYASPPQAAAGLAYAGSSSPPQAAGSGYRSPPKRKQASHEGSLPNPYGDPSDQGHDAMSPGSVYPPTELSHQGGHARFQAPPSQPPSYHY